MKLTKSDKILGLIMILVGLHIVYNIWGDLLIDSIKHLIKTYCYDDMDYSFSI